MIGNIIQTLVGNSSPCGPHMSDLEVCQDLAKICSRLGAEENAQVQLDKVDRELGFLGSGMGRLDKIKRLKEGQPK